MYYPRMERQDQYVRLLARTKEMDNKLNEIIAEIKAINEKIDHLMKSSQVTG